MAIDAPACPLERITRIRFFVSPLFHWCILTFGALLRLSQFLYNRSLTEGEAALALNIIEKSYAQLLQPLDYAQAAPAGFLLMQRFMVSSLGNTEMTMRILPLIAGIASLILFYHAGKRILKPAALTISLILFACGDHLIYFASEVKQYSTDVFWGLCILLLALKLLEQRKNHLLVILFSVVSALSLWFSHPALFVFGACALVITIVYIRDRSSSTPHLFLVSMILPAASFVLNYTLVLAVTARSEPLVTFWQTAFMPFPPTSLSDLAWYPYVFLRAFKFPVGLSPYTLGIAVAAFLCGFLTMAQRKKSPLALLAMIAAFTLTASALHRYPFEGRLILFLTPALIFIIAEGTDFLRTGLGRYYYPASILVVLLLLAFPIGLACWRLVRPRAPEELRPVMEYVHDHNEPGDVMYLYYASANAYRYYAPRFGFDVRKKPGVEARADWARYFEDLDRYAGKDRVWFLFSHVAITYGVNEEELLVSYLEKTGRRIDHFHASGASAYLYDLAPSNEW